MTDGREPVISQDRSRRGRARIDGAAWPGRHDWAIIGARTNLEARRGEAGPPTGSGWCDQSGLLTVETNGYMYSTARHARQILFNEPI